MLDSGSMRGSVPPSMDLGVDPTPNPQMWILIKPAHSILGLIMNKGK
jgi:hypothetical protein